LVYQIVWTRLAFASFGIITPVLSVVLSVYMLGLALGSWAAGRWIPFLTAKTGKSAVFFYAGSELCIGLGAFAVPKLFACGEYLLLASGETNSFRYLALSALVLAASMLPWCVFMGATFPLMMAFIREQECRETTGFSFLYLANVLGAMCGTFLASLVCLELLGFHGTLWVAAAGNFTIALISLSLGLKQPAAKPSPNLVAATENPPAGAPDDAGGSPRTAGGGAAPPPGLKGILFATGFAAMAMEVVWTRAFTPVLKTQVYSFASIVFVYLGATFLGSWLYRRDLRRHQAMSRAGVLAALAALVLLPVVMNNPAFQKLDLNSAAIDPLSAILLLGSIVPFCALLGYLTPGLVDEFAGGDPARGGLAYAINVLGCILGPLVACYGLLPHLSERYALILLSLPFVFFCLRFRRDYSPRGRWTLAGVVGLALGWSLWGAQDFEGWLQLANPKGAIVRRDYAATVVSCGEGWDRKLLVNGFGMTSLTPITKFMVHLPLVFHRQPPQSALVICFGMGTSYRSAVSWGIDTTVVELVPSVTKAFGYYHADAERFAQATNGQIVIDDGRRFLKRTDRKYDVVVVDPPPPVQAAGSSLLFSTGFYALAKQHLQPGGIVQMWVPGDTPADTTQAIVRSMRQSFPYVRCFRSISDWGVHLLGSMEPTPQLNAREMTDRMPAGARRDLLEWSPSTDAAVPWARMLQEEVPVAGVLNPNPNIIVTDDQPYNEYYLLRLLTSAGGAH
jgi:predicted membrane-bound spermidine synthase